MIAGECGTTMHRILQRRTVRKLRFVWVFMAMVALSLAACSALFTAWTWRQTLDLSQSVKTLQDRLEQVNTQRKAIVQLIMEKRELLVGQRVKRDGTCLCVCVCVTVCVSSNLITSNTNKAGKLEKEGGGGSKREGNRGRERKREISGFVCAFRQHSARHGPLRLNTHGEQTERDLATISEHQHSAQHSVRSKRDLVYKSQQGVYTSKFCVVWCPLKIPLYKSPWRLNCILAPQLGTKLHCNEIFRKSSQKYYVSDRRAPLQ
ncbi:unnamed protein product [Oncorhynchus mykiss]|uniref:Uncharacterized protein n=1 Tax=Oncorhynchus mykiss TaxID=8022 RepID=A0A060X481_ONCMY|nr:unnamed protein product [Oncorhynchus mykiss]